MGGLRARVGWLPAALALYLALAWGARGFGVVGEVAAAWTSGGPPRVAVSLAGGTPVWSDPALAPSAGSALGPLLAAQSRPVERLGVAGTWVPLAVNAYTGGLADWPARALHGLTRSAGAVVALHVLFGALLLAAAHRLGGSGGRPGADLCALVLASDWAFVFYRRVLGGTEALLLAAGLGFLAVIVARRWRRGGGGEIALGLLLGLGLQAKATFACTALAFGSAAWLTRRDRGAGSAGDLRWGRLLAAAILPLLPLLVASLHRLDLPEAPRIWSHDTLGMQSSRLLQGAATLFSGGPAPAREMPASLGYLLLDPLRWFPAALGAPTASGWGAWLRGLGWLLCLPGAALAWRDRRVSEAGGGLLRLLSIAVPLQVALLWLANRDLHHVAQVAPGLALLAGLSAARLAAALLPAGGGRARILGLLLVLPLVASGSGALLRTPALLDAASARAVTAGGQADLLALLRRAGVRVLWTSDYDLYGVFEVLAPDLSCAHAWGAATVETDRAALTADLLRAAHGGHWLLVRPSAPRIYDLVPDDAAVERAAARAGVSASMVGTLADDRGTWARLFAVGDP